MLVFEWGNKLRGTSHPMSDAREAAKLLDELPLGNSVKAVAEAAAWLESIELETGFTAGHRMRIVGMIDEAARSSLHELTHDYVGARTDASSGRVDCWRALSDYLEKIASGYAQVIAAFEHTPDPEVAQRLPLLLCRAMRAITGKMAIGWMRYLPPDRASWESLVRCYRIATSHKIASRLVQAYPTDPATTCVVYEFATAAMFAAAAPDTLPPRQIELAYRIASTYAGAFACSPVRHEHCQLYMDLERPGPPVRLLKELEPGCARVFFGSGNVAPKLDAVMNEARMAGAGIHNRFGEEFGRSEMLAALQHAMVFWSDNPPLRRESRTRIDSFIKVVVGVRDLQLALGPAGEAKESRHWGVESEGNADRGQAGDRPHGVATPDAWTLTDFSPRGIAARFFRRPAAHVGIGTLFGFRLERSEKWCVAIVRRVRRDGNNHTDIGAEIIAKGAELVSLELVFDGAALQPAAYTAAVRSRAIFLPEAPVLKNQPSLFFEPGTNLPGQVFLLHQNDGARRIRLGPVLDSVDGWDRVGFEWLD